VATEAADPKWLSDQLVETLKTIAERAIDELAEKAMRGGLRLEPVDLALLRATIAEAVEGYEVDAWVAEEVGKMNVHEVVDPARAIVAILCNNANDGTVFDALGDGDFFEGIARRDVLIADLEKLAARGAQCMPRKRPRARPARIDLRLLVGHLANSWTVLTKTHFSSAWAGIEPVSPGAQFVHAVVAAVDPASLPHLPTAARWVVKARRNGKLPGYFGGAGRRDAGQTLAISLRKPSD